MDPITTAIDTVLPATKFTIFSGILKTSRSSDGKMRLHGVASSTTKDLHGDTMQSSAIEDMERSANNNMTIFLNHSYAVPEDVAGSVESARMKTRGVDGEGNPNYDLDMDIIVNESNERAVKAFEAIERGTKLGLSIGALIPEGGATKGKDKGNYIIEHVELLETSLVGIPANPRSWVEYAAKSLRSLDKDAMSVPIGEPTLTLDGSHYKIEGTVDGLKFAATGPDVIADIDPPTADLEPDTTNAACPTCGKSKDAAGDCGDPYHKSIDPDVTDATVTIIEIDTDGSSSSDTDPTDASPPQDGSPTNPDTGDGDVAASGDDLGAITGQLNLDGPATETVQQMLDLLKTTTRELVAAKQKVTELTASVATITSERDTAGAQRDMVLVETKRVLDNLANTPLMRRAVVVAAEQELRSKFSGIYSEDFLKMLETPK